MTDPAKALLDATMELLPVGRSGHTPGPWGWQKFGKEWCLTGQHSQRPIVLAVRKGAITSLVVGLLRTFDPQHPDARLIAAAPDLLKACDAALNTLLADCVSDGGNQSLANILATKQLLRAAINKATKP